MNFTMAVPALFFVAACSSPLQKALDSSNFEAAIVELAARRDQQGVSPWDGVSPENVCTAFLNGASPKVARRFEAWLFGPIQNSAGWDGQDAMDAYFSALDAAGKPMQDPCALLNWYARYGVNWFISKPRRDDFSRRVLLQPLDDCVVSGLGSSSADALEPMSALLEGHPLREKILAPLSAGAADFQKRKDRSLAEERLQRDCRIRVGECGSLCNAATGVEGAVRGDGTIDLDAVQRNASRARAGGTNCILNCLQQFAMHAECAAISWGGQ